MQTKHVTIVAKAPTARGTFDGEIVANPPEGDKDGERIESWLNLPGTFPLVYMHTYGDLGARIGNIEVRPIAGGKLFVAGKLDIKQNPLAAAVHERMLLSSSDPMALSELSVGFHFDPALVTKDANGVRAIRDAEMLEVSIVYRGAQTTSISNVKVGARNSGTDLALIQRIHDEAMALGAVCPGEHSASAPADGKTLTEQLDALERDIETRMVLAKLEHSLTIEGRVEDLERTTRMEQELRDLERELKDVKDRRAAFDRETRREVYGPPKRIVTAASSDPAGRSREALMQVR
jgi:hypothetical protein